MRQAKSPLRKHRVVRKTWERDYDDPVWSEHPDLAPTPQSHPDAFYALTAPAYPRPVKASLDRPRRTTLSQTQRRKRLSRAGLRGAELRRVLDDLNRGPRLDPDAGLALTACNRLALGWNVEHLEQTFGRRLSRRLLHGLQPMLVFFDEAWLMLSSPAMTEVMAQWRKCAARPVEVVQSFPDNTFLHAEAAALLPRPSDAPAQAPLLPLV